MITSGATLYKGSYKTVFKILSFALIVTNSWLKSILSLAFSTQDLAMMFIAHLCVVLAWLISPFSSCPFFSLSNQYFSRRRKSKCFSHHVTQCCYPHPIKWEQSSIVQTECFWPSMALQYIVIYKNNSNKKEFSLSILDVLNSIEAQNPKGDICGKGLF